MLIPSGSNLDHALLYHSLGWWVFPGRSPLDVVNYRQALIRQGMSSEAAYQEAERSRKHTPERWAKCPKSCTFERTDEAPFCPKHERRKLGEAGRPTEAEIREWFDGEPARPVIILTGPNTCAEGQIVGVDVDTAKGGDAAPWTGPEVTMLASTPSGGFHAYHLANNAEVFKNSEKGVAPGVDIRAAGGLLVAPSGEEATPGRKWLRWGAMSPVPGDEIRQRLAARKGLVRAPVDAEDEDAIPPPPAQRGFTQACLEPTDKMQGGRMSRMKALTGPLAWLHPLPPDAVDAALMLLTEDAQDRGIEEEQIAELAVMWREALEADSRSLRFVLTVLHAWNNLRCIPRWSPERLESQVRSTWQTANAREREFKAKQGAGHAPEVAEVAEDEVEEEGPRGGIFEPPQPADPDADELADVYFHRHHQFSRVTGRDLGEYEPKDIAKELLPSRRSLYSKREFRQKLATPILSCAVLPPWQTITAGGIVPDAANVHGHGLGPEIDVALAGGLRPGQLILLGAKTAKAGKTALADQLLDGLGLRSLDVLAKLARDEKTSELIVVRYDFSEMGVSDLSDRQLGRWLGMDSTVFRRGDQAHLAPGIRRRAPSLHLSLEELATLVINAGEAALDKGTLADLRDIQMMPKIDLLPSASDAQPDEKGRQPFKAFDHQAGVLLLRKMVEQIKIDRRSLAEQWGVPEAQICPLIFVDPIQRYQGSGASAVEALDGFAKALKDTAIALQCIVVATSDTNKDNATGSAKQGTPGKPKGDTRNQGERVASTLRGSYAGTTHAPDLTLMIEREDDDAEVRAGEPIKVRLSTGANRWLARSISIPLWFDPETGRYTVRVETAPPNSDGEEVPDLPPDEVEVDTFDGRLSPAVAEVVALFRSGHDVAEIASQRGNVVPKTITRQLRKACDVLGLDAFDDLRDL